jgi:thiopeptide-type bacteriocin biosynthesis protein
MPPEAWLQVNCSLFVQAGRQAPFVPWAELNERLESWRREARLDQFFFMRKPPALRLRFQGPDLTRRLEPVLVAWLEDAEQRNLIRSFRFGTYEPEVFRFGGQTGMAIAHEQFDRDSRLILRYETAVEQGTLDLPRERLSATLMLDLLQRCVEDQAEVWDVWQRIWHAHGCPPLAQDNQTDLATPADVSLLEESRAGNAQVACRLHAAEVARRLDCGPRAWLAQVCVFHWNRLGLEMAERVRLLSATLRSFDPHRVDP